MSRIEEGRIGIRSIVTRQELMAGRLERVVKQIAGGYRCKAELQYISQVPVLKNHDDCTAHVFVCAMKSLLLRTKTGCLSFHVYIFKLRIMIVQLSEGGSD